MGAQKVVSRAEQDVQAKFLLRNGADEIIYPENNLPYGRQYVTAPTIFSII